MILGLLLIAMIAAAAVSVTLVFLSAPLWLALLAYPVTGTAVLLSGVALVGNARAQTRAARALRRQTGVLVPVQCPVPRRTTPTVATRTRRSVASDSLRS